jgi:nucleoside-diphosphate-sugar epimerase
MKVLVTGAAGTIGSLVRERLAGRYELSYLTLEPEQFPSTVADIADLDAIQPAFEGMDAVVHLAASPSVETPWEEILHNNIIGTRNVYEAARRAGVAKVVFASSNHAVGMYEAEGSPDIYALGDPRTIDETVPVRPDSLYGVSKVFGEAIGRYYVDNHGLRVLCLRIGTVRADDDPRSEDAGASSGWLKLTREQTYDRLRATWLSHRDCAQLIARCLDNDTVSFGVYYGISNNPRQLWDLSRARRELGYAPEDSAGE